eukprot:347162-Hanusia_phi.AAC.1
MQGTVEEALASSGRTWECLQLVCSSAAAGQQTVRELERQVAEAAARERSLEETIEEARSEARRYREEASGLRQNCEKLKQVILQSQRASRSRERGREAGETEE